MKPIIHKMKSSKKIQLLLGVVLFVLFVSSVLYYTQTVDRISIENSLVNAPLVTVSPSTSGILKQILVAEGQTIHKGDSLAIVGSDVLYAYTDGIVVMTNKQVGGTVNPTTPIVQLVNPNDMRIDGQLDENKGLNAITVGQPVSFTIDALPGKTFWGYIDEVSPTARQTQIAFSISSDRPTQQFDIYARFDATALSSIKNGMSAKMTVYTK